MMRYEKKIAVLGGTLVILLAIWVAGILFSPERRAARSESMLLLTGKIEDAAVIEIGSPKVLLRRESGAWFLVEEGSKLPARESRIESLLESAQAVKRLKPMARSKDAWRGLGLEEGEAKPVLIRDGQGRTMADFLVGGYGTTGGETYLRLAGSEASYAAEGSFASYASSTRKAWLDLAVMPGPLPESDVEALAIRASIALDGPGTRALVLDYALRRGKAGWEGIAGAVNPVAVSSLIRSILNLEGEDIVVSPPPSAFSPVAARVELSLGNGSSRVLEVGSAAGEGRFHLRLAGKDLVYAVSVYGLRNALKAPGELLVQP